MENLFDQVKRKDITSLCEQYLMSLDIGHCTGDLFTNIIKAYGYENPDSAFLDHGALWQDHLTEFLCKNILLLDPERSRAAKVIPCKANNSVSWKIVLPKTWITKMHITPKDREVCVLFDGRTILIRKWNAETDLSICGSKKANIIFSTAVSTVTNQYKSCRISFPDSLMKEMKITRDSRDVLLQFENTSIQITKC